MGSDTALSVTIVGPASGRSGGMAQYVSHQRRHLADRVRVQVHDLPAISPTDCILRLVGSYCVATLRSLWGAVRFARLRRTDVVHVHTAQSFEAVRSTFYVLYASLVWQSTVVLHVHGSTYDDFLSTDSRLLAFGQALLFAGSDSIIVLTEYWERQLATRVPWGKLFVLPNAVDSERFTPAPRTDPPELLFLAHLTERKGIDELVTAIERLAGEPVQVRIHLAGIGPKAEAVRSLARNHENVTYHGYVSEPKKRRLHERSTVFVLPSRAEGMPITILEAMAGGSAIVSTTVGGIPDFVGASNGILVPPGDPEGLADALMALLEDPDRTLQMAMANRRLVEARYAWNRVGDRLLDHYSELVQQEEPHGVAATVARWRTGGV